MARKGSRQEKTIAGDKSTPLAFGTLLARYLEALEAQNYAEGSIRKRRLQLNAFVQWCELRSLTSVTQITRTELERYQRQLRHELDRRGKPRSVRNQHERLVSVRSWFKWLTRKRHLLHNPASELDLPKLGTHLPSRVLSPSEAEAILARARPDERLGLRDRSILETFYSTGIRRLELIHLKLQDVSDDRGVLTVRQGKARKDRVVPIGDRALAWMKRYTTELRPKLLARPDEPTVYLTRDGEPFSPSFLSILVARYVSGSEAGGRGSCHLFRHAMATAMHDGGADVRHIQAMLGHASLRTTEIYTHVSIQKLKQIHQQTHPARHFEGPNR